MAHALPKKPQDTELVAVSVVSILFPKVVTLRVSFMSCLITNHRRRPFHCFEIVTRVRSFPPTLSDSEVV